MYVNKLAVITTLTARNCSQNKLLKFAEQLVEPTRAEQGCLGYYLFRNRDESAGLIELIYFENNNAYNDHINSSHVELFFKQTKNCGMVYNARIADLIVD